MSILTGPVTATATTFSVSDDSLLLRNGLPQMLQIESEKFLIRGYEAVGTHNTRWYVERGVDGSIAASHSGGVAITVVSVGGGGGVSVTVQDTDPGAVGAGNLWIRTDAAANYAPVLLVRNPTNDGWVDQATGGYYLGATSYRDNGTVAFSTFTTPNADNYELEMWGAPLTRIADFLMYRDSGGVIWLRSMDEASVDKSSVKIAPTGIELTGIPTADPHVVGQLWNSSGTLKISAG